MLNGKAMITLSTVGLIKKDIILIGNIFQNQNL